MLGARSARIVGSAMQAREALASGTKWEGFIFDVKLPEGHDAGMDLLREVRANDSTARLPAVVLTGHFEEQIAHAATELRAWFIPKPVTYAKLEQFLEYTGWRWIRTRRELAERARSDHALSDRQTEIVAWVLEGRHPKTFCVHYDITYDTFKNHRKALLEKIGVADLESLVSTLFGDALGLEPIPELEAISVPREVQVRDRKAIDGHPAETGLDGQTDEGPESHGRRGLVNR